ncbi:MAG: cell wall-associated NlpC family hydrolase [Sulfurimonas sp.]|jgi:cell wall-associated NlpC family hydrolase
MFRLLFVMLCALIIFSGCSTKRVKHPSRITTHAKLKPKPKPSYKPKEDNWVTTALYTEYKKWYKTPYEYGGEDEDGIDCSALIQIVYKDAFNIKLPRTTKAQVKKGYLISKKSTQEGDLVFFKTGFKTRHAGIIIEKNKFIHTSSKNGVSVSSLNNPYWKRNYWQSRRILP